MRHFIPIFLILILTSVISTAQILKGKVTNQSGDPIQYSTVYIQELKQGTTSNTKGDYEIKISCR
ncbi:MAG: carboxypeptidase-like regulatory domain-containing protein [Bacteroidetes bacterium]|nr:carboxypeptidase-like regulatory domain-containing protein [Bacteroidota bacterium]